MHNKEADVQHCNEGLSMLINLAAGHDETFTAVLCLPALLGFIGTLWRVTTRLSSAPGALVRPLVLSSGLFGLFFAAGYLTVLPHVLRSIPFVDMCIAIPLTMLALGASWGVFAAGVILLNRKRKETVAIA
jgi:ABC-type methionine transport system permease subunit